MKLLTYSTLIAIFFAGGAIGQTCVETQTASHADGQFIDRKDGTLLDVTTNLLWSKCNVGETYNTTLDKCDGSATKFSTWKEALDATTDTNITTIGEHTGFRLPNIKELTSIVDYRCSNPTINLDYFPTTMNDPYWTNTPDAQGINADYDGLVIDFEEALEVITDQGDIPAPLIRLVKEFQ